MTASPRRAALLFAIAALALAPLPARAIDSCRARIDKKTGVIQVDASGVGGPLLWGSSSGAETNAFFNAGSCVAADKAKRCQLANPASLDSKTAPAGCTLYLNDGVAACSAWISGCSPGARRDTGVLLKDANGSTICTVLESNPANCVRDAGGTTIQMRSLYDGSGFESLVNLAYASNDCSGTPLMFPDASMARSVAVHGPTAYFPPTSTSNTALQSQLYLASHYVDQTICDAVFGAGITTFQGPNGCCMPGAFGIFAVGTAQTLDLSVYATPFKIEVQ